MARSKKERSVLNVKTEINITPLMDIMCMLMMLFMITSPMLEYDTDVSLPKLTTKNNLDEKNGITVNIKSTGVINCDNKSFHEAEELLPVFKSRFARNKDTRILIRADEKNQMSLIFKVIRISKEAGISNIGLVSAQEN